MLGVVGEGGGWGGVQTRCIMGYVQMVNLGDTCLSRLACLQKMAPRRLKKNQVVKYDAFSKIFFY